jgi:hypothetical protein
LNSLTPDKSELSFELTGTVPSQVDAGDAVELVDHTWLVTVPGSVLDVGIGLGLLSPGDTVSGSLVASVFASNTDQGTVSSAKIPVVFGPITADAVTGLADPASSTVEVGGLEWTTVGGTVGFAMASAQVAVKIGSIDITFTCEPKDLNLAFVGTDVIGDTGRPPGGRDPSEDGDTTSPTVLGNTATKGGSLPKTGFAPFAPVALALGLLDLGYLAVTSTKLPRRRSDTTR